MFDEALNLLLGFNSIVLIYFGVKTYFRKSSFELLIVASSNRYVFLIPKSVDKSVLKNIYMIKLAREKMTESSNPDTLSVNFDILKASLLAMEKEIGLDKREILKLLNDLTLEIEYKTMRNNMNSFLARS